ncbi:MAG: hypothetical protein KJ619_07090 [Candidatus Omnitrophica bacterium]|nr:hypothetical protein [Candidatus Omnitrophota bacterium]
MPEQFKRRNYFIDKKFQTIFILKFCLIVILSSLLVVGGVLFFSQGSNTVAIENTKVIVKGTADFILPITLATSGVVLLFSAIAVLVLTLLVSHKIAGPLYRLRNEITAMQEADFRRNFHIRGGDQLQELAKALDIMCKSLKDKHLELKTTFKALSDFLNHKDFKVSPKDADQLREYLDKLQAQLDKFKA